MNILLAPDSFKGTLSAREACEIEARAINDVLPDARITMLPMADGGEGMADACLSVFGGERTACCVTGPDGNPVDAAYVLLPDGSAAIEMEADMTRFAAVLKKTFPNFDAAAPGAGVAGGMGAAIKTFPSGTLRPGIELLLDAAKFDALAAHADLIITGEGRMDAQSLHGKVPCGVAKRAQRAGKPCLAVCGALGDGAERMKEVGITALYAASDGHRMVEELQKTCRSALDAAMHKALLEQFSR